ncbi:MAG: HD domain-containing phosphohydrolase [Candidatus Omnitrophota bacterium]|nr:HD domain-containing phosphohydrolase [Candidatus Omnitrophota bacterium]
MTSGWVGKIAQNPATRRLQKALSVQVPTAAWWQIEGGNPKPQDWRTLFRSCHCVRPDDRKRFQQRLDRARRKGEPVQFDFSTGKHVVCFPLLHNGQVKGYLGICSAGGLLSPSTVELVAAGLEAVVRENEKSEEIRTLAETIQPRCVALSTIHTIHRLISSTLNLEELLPRVARLCCQVLRAQACVIWLMEKDKPVLVPRAVVNMRKGRGEAARPFRVGAGIPGTVASTCKADLTPQKMVVPLVEEECLGVILVRRADHSRPFSPLDQEILTTLAEQAVVAIRNAQMYETQERVTWGTIRSLSAILDGMDSYSPAIVSGRKIMADVAMEIAREMGLSAAQQKSIQYAALLHDAGRVGIPDEILHKPSKLEPAEYDTVKQHTVKGASLLEPLEILEPAIPIILYHHERYDGTGYPKGLKKEAIPLGARILAVANAFEAMVCERSYRKSVPVQEAAKEIAVHSGTQFDPKVVKAFLAIARRGQLERFFAEK